MASGTKSYVLNRESDWKRKSVISNIDFKDDVFVSCSKTGDNGVYISTAFNSDKTDTVWHRIRFDSEIPQNATFKLKLFASNDENVVITTTHGKQKFKKINLNDFILDSNIDVIKKINVFNKINSKVYVNPKDTLIFDLVGKYLWVCIEIINYEKKPVKIKTMKIEFPKASFIDYLPEIYRDRNNENAFLDRFLGIFQSIYVDFEDEIDYSPIKFDVDRMNKDFLHWICSWFSIKEQKIWGEKKLRHLLKNAVKIYKIKGTKLSIAQMVNEFVGAYPIIVEQFDIKDNQYYGGNKEVLENLYGDNGFVFSVIVNDSQVKTPEEYVELHRVINSVKPIDAICNLVVLNKKIYLNHHCYLGINSYIEKNHELVIGKEDQEPDSVMLVSSAGS